MAMRVYKRPEILTDVYSKYCGGCGHGIVNKLIAEVIEEKGLREETIMIWPIGCSVYGDQYFKLDSICALHGRAPAVATGIKRTNPEKTVLVYQGDGDLVSEGMAEIIHAAIRGENYSVIFINNAIYGMTGGQMAPTTIIGQKTTTSPFGKSEKAAGHEVNTAEMISLMKGCYYSERVTVTSYKHILSTKRAIARAIDYQNLNRGLSLVEVLSPCPTGWNKSPADALEWINSSMTKHFPLGVFKAPPEADENV